MERRHGMCAMTLGVDEPDGTPSDDEETQASGYRPPALFVIGKAVDLVQGYSYGKYSDGYSGYYWER